MILHNNSKLIHNAKKRNKSLCVNKHAQAFLYKHICFDSKYKEILRFLSIKYTVLILTIKPKMDKYFF